MRYKACRARCPAKINLMLRVLGRREDGYHELDTVFQAIDLWDELEIHPSLRLELECDDPELPGDDSNLVLRAARRLAESFPGTRAAGRLVLRKRIPRQAGLGGGSSDAAAALLLCARFWEVAPDRARLESLAAELGADVPFFLTGGRARGTGRGDHVAPLPFPGRTWLMLGTPPFGLSTAEVFSRLGARLTLPANGVSLPVPFAHKWPEGNDFSLAANDLESVAFDGWPELKGFRDALLRSGAERALLSGSGSTVYGVFADRGQRDRVRPELERGFPEWTLTATHTVEDGVRLDRTG